TPQLEVFRILLGREPALSPVIRFYQRLLAGDEDEAAELADEYLEQHGLVALYDEVIVPALHPAETDRHSGRLHADAERTVREISGAIVEDLAERPHAADSGADAAHGSGSTRPPTERPVLCVPARDEADALAAGMFAQVLHVQGITAEAVSQELLVGEIGQRLGREDIPLICISALPPGAISHTRYLCKRLGARLPELTIVVGLWNASENLGRMRTRLMDSGADRIVTTFAAGAAEVARKKRELAAVASGRHAEDRGEERIASRPGAPS
ncbi:MAG TPA: hypothetical protein VF265_00860, partial [Nevskiaceae bacterium]